MSYLDVELAPLRIPLKDIVKATKDFANENLLKRRRNSDVYKGKGLILGSEVEIDVVIQKNSRHTHIYEFYEVIKRLLGFKHKNAVSLIGFCDEKGERMIVMEHVVNGSLDKYLTYPMFLRWSQRLNICYGAALALGWWNHNDEISYGFKILLDKDWEAKVLLNIDSWPDDSKKSVLYSLGVILLEVLYGRKVTTEDVNQYLAQMGETHFKEGELDVISDPNQRKQMQRHSLSIYLQTAYNCLKAHYTDMNEIVERLKKALELQLKHENVVRSFAYLKIPLSHITLATDTFANTHLINLDNDNIVYKAELDTLDGKYAFTIKGENRGELVKEKVIIKRIVNQTHETVTNFFAEIEMLAYCEHPNLVPLLGFCDEGCEMILVFEWTFKETLEDYLGSTNNRADLSWEQRIRICLDVAKGLQYLQTSMADKPSMIHRGRIHSAYVLLDEKWSAKITNFRFFRFNSYFTSLWQLGLENARSWSWNAMVVDDISSLGIILFEILTGRLACTPFYMVENVGGVASMALRDFNEKQFKYMVDPKMMKEAQECSNTLRKGPNQNSLDTFSKLAYQCLIETPSKRPTLEVVIESLEKALHYQEVQILEHMKIPLEDILLATENFNRRYCVGSGGYGDVYKAELNHFDIKKSLAIKMKSKVKLPQIPNTVAIKRIFNREDGQGKEGFLSELEVLGRCEHPNIISLLGCCVEGSEMLLVYEYASNGSLDNYLESTVKVVHLTWSQRLKMCIDIAQGLNYLHTNMADKSRIIHRDIKSANILLGENWEAKIADFGLSKLFPVNHRTSTMYTNNIAGTEVYMDPEYGMSGSLKRASDIYSLGVVLFEIFSGKLAYDLIYTKKKKRGLAPIAKRHFEMKTLIKEMLDPKTMDDEAYELGLTIKVRPGHDSLDVFSRIAYLCLAKAQAERPTIEVVIKELNKALYFQENRMKTLRISLEDIKVGVENFSDDNCVGRGGHGMLYKGKVHVYNNRHSQVVVKRFSKSGQEDGFLKEFEVLFKYRQENIIGLVGYCREMDEKIIVYEHASRGSLNRYLNNSTFTWTKRLKVCIDIANGLKFLHGGDIGQDVLIHRDITSSNILLTEDWKAKICAFEFSLSYPTNQEMEYVISDVVGSPGYCDPLYWKTNILTKESDIYSFGVILFEILCGRLACPVDFRDRSQFLGTLAKHHCQVARLEEIVFEGIKEQIIVKSFSTFQRIALQCLHNDRKERPTAGDVVVQLQKALEFQEAYEMRKGKLDRTCKEILHQFSMSPEIYSTMRKNDIYNIFSKGILIEDDKVITHASKQNDEPDYHIETNDEDYHSKPDDEDYNSESDDEDYYSEPDDDDYHSETNKQEAYDIWEAKLPRNYKEVLQFSESPEIYSTMSKKDIYNTLSKGILLQDDKLWFSIGDNGERNEMIGARLFSFKNRWSHRWRSIQESRFRTVARMSDISNLNIEIKISSQLLPLDIKYSVHLVFKFCGPRKSHAKRIYVNLKYKMGSENLHAYFATWRDDDWMMIELCRFANKKKDTDFEVLLEGFSRCYCGSPAIYIEGIEFRAIDNVKQEKTKKIEEVQQVLKSPSKIKIKKDHMLWYPLSKMKRKVYHMESAKGVVYNFSNVRRFNLKLSAQSRGEWIYKVPQRSVFCIKWNINEYQMVSPYAKSACYLVFKLSENCHGLHCPVIVRDQFNWKSKEIVYFRSPSPWNLHETDHVPKKRRDGWMEVVVSKFNSDFVDKKGCLFGNLKFVSYERTMSGLIIRGLEFRQISEE